MKRFLSVIVILFGIVIMVWKRYLPGVIAGGVLILAVIPHLPGLISKLSFLLSKTKLFLKKIFLLNVTLIDVISSETQAE